MNHNNNIGLFMPPKYLLFVIFIAFFKIDGFSQIDENDSAEQFVSKLLFQKKIVMFGDDEHHSYNSFIGVLNVLEEWLKKAEKDSNSITLTYIVENSEEQVNNLLDYLNTDNVDFLLNQLCIQGYIDDLAYSSHLKLIYDRIKKINKTRKNKILFNIKGFEPYKLFNEANNLREKDSVFVFYRDSIIAQDVIDYVQNHSNEQILIFYGTMHLIKSIHRMGTVSHFFSDAEKSWLAKILSDKFGFEAVVSVDRKLISDSSESKIIKLDDGNFDYRIIRKYKIPPYLPVNTIFSKKVIKENIFNIKNLGNIFVYKFAVDGAFRGLFIITGKNIRTGGFSLDSLLNAPFYGIKRIDSPEFAFYFKSTFYGYINDSNIRKMLRELGLGPNVVNINWKPDEKYWSEKFWPAAQRNIKILNCIGIYWVGTDEERREAKEFLKSIANMDSNNPYDYYLWWLGIIGFNK